MEDFFGRLREETGRGRYPGRRHIYKQGKSAREEIWNTDTSGRRGRVMSRSSGTFARTGTLKSEFPEDAANNGENKSQRDKTGSARVGDNMSLTPQQ